MKKIGVIGGLSPESTLLFYKYMIEEYKRMRDDTCYPEIIIYSVSFCEFSNYMRSDRRKAFEVLKRALKSLESAGAEVTVIAANTPHMFFDDLLKQSKIPLISIVDALAEELKDNQIKRVGLLGTKATLTEGFYVERLKLHGIDVILPDLNEIEKVNEIIMNELVRGEIKDESKDFIISVARRLVERGAEGVALSCTELPLVFNQETGFKVFDTARILARKLIQV